MEPKNKAAKSVLLLLCKDFSATHTVTSLANEIKLSRVGIWKILKRLEREKYIAFKPVGAGKTSTSIIKLNWDNVLVEKVLALYLTEEALKQRRWRVNFTELDTITDFAIMYGSIIHFPQEANDIDILAVATKKKFIKIQNVIDNVQKMQIKKIHSINFTEKEFKTELEKPNKAFLEAIKKGVVLFGQENFVRFVKGVEK
jgi:DNA-binding Lrp family transcriptional regulator